MSDATKIEWSDASWNPVTGCTKVSPGCDRCYAETFAERWRGTKGHYFEYGFDLTLRPERLDQPLRWTKPRRIFVNSMSDLFHDDIPDKFIAEVFAVMALAERHTFQVLTKRHGRMRSLLSSGRFVAKVWGEVDRRAPGVGAQAVMMWPSMPLPNVWLGVSVEDQKRADLRVPALLGTPAAVRWVSAEPLLGPVDLSRWMGALTCGCGGEPGGPTLGCSAGCMEPAQGGLDWVVTGGESGPGARPADPTWFRAMRDQCAAADVAYLHKQNGEYLTAAVEDDPKFSGGRAFKHPLVGRSAAVVHERGPSGTFRNGTWRPMRPGDRTKGAVMLDEDTIAVRVGKKRAGRELDGRTWDEFPDGAR